MSIKRGVTERASSDATSTEALLNDLKERGFELQILNNNLMVSPASKVTPVIREAVRGNGAQLMRLLSADAARDDMKRCVSETVPSDATFYECPVDGRPCEVLEPVRPAIEAMLEREDLDKLVEGAKDYGLPCGGCRKGTADACNLSGLKLGRHERRVLLTANGELYENIYPEEPGRAAEEANRRALRKLERVGLVKLGRHYASMQRNKENPPPKWFHSGGRRYWMRGRTSRSAVLTPLGVAVVDRCRDELESGAAIRWSPLREVIAQDVRKPLHELLGQFGHYVEGAAFYSGFGVAFGRTAKDKKDAAKRREAYTQLRAFVSEEASKCGVP